MGGSESRTVIKQTIQDVATIIQKDHQDCSTTLSAEQILNIAGNNIDVSGVNMTQKTMMDVQCVGASEISAEMLAEIKSKVKATYENKSDLLAGILSRSDSSIEQTLDSFSEMMVNKEMLQSCALNANDIQILNITGNNIKVSDITMEQTLDIFKSCVMDSAVDVIKKLGYDFDAEADTKVEQSVLGNTITAIGKAVGSLIQGLFTGLATPLLMLFVLLIIFIIIITVIGKSLGGGGTKVVVPDTNPYNPYTNPDTSPPAYQDTYNPPSAPPLEDTLKE